MVFVTPVSSAGVRQATARPLPPTSTATAALATAVNQSMPEYAKLQYGQQADWRAVADGVAESVKASLVDMAILTAWGPWRAAARDMARWRRFGPEALQIATLRQVAQESKLFQRSSAAGEEAVAALLQDLPEVPRQLYADVDGWDRVARERGRDPRQLAAELLGDDGKAYDRARVTNGDLAIPVEKALPKVLATELGDALAQDLKLSPDGLTLNQAAKERARIAARVTELAGRGVEQLSTESRAIYEAEKAKALRGVKGTEAEKDGEKVADAHGRTVAAQAETLAERYGGTAGEWYRKLGYERASIVGPEDFAATPAAGPALEQGDLARVQAGPEGYTHPGFPLALQTTVEGDQVVASPGLDVVPGQPRSTRAPANEGYSTAIYLKALMDAQAAGRGWRSDFVRTPATEAMYRRLVRLGVPFERSGDYQPEVGGHYAISKEALAKVKLDEAWRTLLAEAEIRQLGLGQDGVEPGALMSEGGRPPEERPIRRPKRSGGPPQAGVDIPLDAELNPIGVDVSAIDRARAAVGDEERSGKVARVKEILEESRGTESVNGVTFDFGTPGIKKMAEGGTVEGVAATTKLWDLLRNAILWKVEDPRPGDRSTYETLLYRAWMEIAGERRRVTIRVNDKDPGPPLGRHHQVYFVESVEVEKKQPGAFSGTAAKQELGQVTPTPGKPTVGALASDVKTPTRDPGQQATGPSGPRGSFHVVLPDGGAQETYVIRLFGAADRTTLAHESAHLFTRTLGQLASAEGAPEGLRADYQVLLGAMGFATHAEREAASADRTELAKRKAAGETLSPEEQARLTDLTAREERLSHLWEAYLAEGKAPTAELAGVFRRFKNWMAAAYKQVAGPLGQFGRRFEGQPKLELTPEVKAVFDRLLATDEELAGAERAAGGQPVEAALERMTPEDRSAWETDVGQARAAAEQALLARIAAANAREDAAWFKGERVRLEAEVGAEVDASPAYRALQALREGAAEGVPPELLRDEAGAPLKLDRAALVKEYGAELVRSLPKGIFAEKGGAGVEDMAGRLGFGSGAELVRTLAAVEPRERVVEREARARLEALYGPSLVSDRAALAEAALDAVHTPKAMKAAIRAMGRLARRLGPDVAARLEALSPELLLGYARRTVGELPVGKATPESFLRSERAAADRARDAYRAGNDARGLVEDEARLVNQALYIAATEARERVQKAEAKVRQAGGEAWRTSLGKAGAAWRDATDTILEAVGLGPAAPPGTARLTFDAAIAEAEKTSTLLAFDLDGVREVLAARTPWAELTPDQAENLADAVKNLRRAANLQNEAQLLDRRVTRDEIIAGIESDARAARPKQPKVPFDPMLDTQAWTLGQRVRGLDGMLLRVERMVEMLAGGDRDSWAYKTVIDPWMAAKYRKEELAKTYLAGLMEKFEALPQKQRLRLYEELDLDGDLPLPPELVAAANLDTRRTRGSLLMVALNMGNAGNKQRLLDGYGWTEKQVLDALGKHLSREELLFSQGVIDSLEGLWPQIAELHERETGLLPGKIVAEPWQVQLADGRTVELAGGYFPAKYDPRAGMSQRGFAAQEKLAQSLLAPYSSTPATAKGHTKARAAKVEDVVDLNWRVVPAHVNQVLHDLAYRPFVRQTASLLADPRMESLLARYLGPERARQFVPWLQAVANDGTNAVPANERSLAALSGLFKARAVTQAIGHSIAVAAGDLTNPLVALAAGEVSAKQLAIATTRMGALWRGDDGGPRKTIEWAQSLSPELRFRAERANQRLRTELDAMGGELGRTNPKLRALRESAFWLMELTDKLTATPVWVARFNQELAEGRTHEDAVRRADATVRAVFPAESAAEKSHLLRSGWAANLLMFHGFANTLYNVKRGLFDEMYRTVTSEDATKVEKTTAVAKFAAKLAGVAIASTALSELLSGRGREQDETWGDWGTRKIAAGMLLDLPFVGGAGEALISKAQGTSVKFSLRTNPGLEAGVSLASSMAKLATKGWDSEEGWAAALNAAGFLFNVPTRQVTKTGRYLASHLEEDIQFGDARDVATGLLYGRRFNQPASPFDAMGDAADAVTGGGP